MTSGSPQRMSRQPTNGPTEKPAEAPRNGASVAALRAPASRSASTPTPPSKIFLLMQMLACATGVYVCFGWWSVKQERLIKKPYDCPTQPAAGLDAASSDATAGSMAPPAYFSTAYGIVLCQSLAGVIISVMALSVANLFSLVRGKTTSHPRRSVRGANTSSGGMTAIDFVDVAVMGLTNVLSSSFSYAAMRRLSYPVSLAAKMAKMLPVMLVGYFWHRTRYPTDKVVSCLLITAGVTVFYFIEQLAAPEGTATSTRHATQSSSGTGLLLLLVNLCLDGYTYSTQDVLVKRRQWNGLQLMFWVNIASTICVALLLFSLEVGEQPVLWLLHHGISKDSLSLLWQQFRSGAGLWTTHGGVNFGTGANLSGIAASLLPFRDFSRMTAFLSGCAEARNDLAAMSLSNVVGQLFIFHTISVFGTLTLTAMTLLRKTGSIALSIFVHGHQINGAQWMALGTVFAGVIWEGWINIQEASRKKRRLSLPSAPPASSTASHPPPALSPSKGRSKNSGKTKQQKRV